MLTIPDHGKPNWSIFAGRWTIHDNLSHQQQVYINLDSCLEGKHNYICTHTHTHTQKEEFFFFLN